MTLDISVPPSLSLPLQDLLPVLLCQRLLTVGLGSKRDPMPAFVSKVLLEHSRIHSFTD